MGYSYISKSHDCDMCGTRIHDPYQYSVDNPTDGDTWDEYCKTCYTELGGMYWTGNWTGDNRNPIVLDNEGNKVVRESMV
jgi:hypothetical protein